MSHDITEVYANRTYKPRDARGGFSTDNTGRLIVAREPTTVCKSLLVNTSKPDLHKFAFAANNLSLWEVSFYGDMMTAYSWYVQSFLKEKHKKNRATLGFVEYCDIDGVTMIPREKSLFYTPTLVISVPNMTYDLQKPLPRVLLIGGAEADIKRVTKAFVTEYKGWLAENTSPHEEAVLPLLAALPEKAKKSGLNIKV